jgi:hypothetical protein
MARWRLTKHLSLLTKNTEMKETRATKVIYESSIRRADQEDHGRLTAR